MTKDAMMRERQTLRPGYSWECRGKGIKPINRKIARKRLKRQTEKEIANG